VAPINNAGTIPVCAVSRDASGACPGSSELAVPIGNISFAAPNFQNNRNIVFNLDFTQSANTLHHARFIYNRQHLIDNLATFPDFFALVPIDGRLFSYTLIHNFTPKLTNKRVWLTALFRPFRSQQRQVDHPRMAAGRSGDKYWAKCVNLVRTVTRS
jgi:hypothetical protein